MVPVLHGILTGLILSIYVGATFFMLIETSITRGFRSALIFDLGIFLSDVFCIVLACFFASEMLNAVKNNWYVGLFGGVAFITFGANYMIRRTDRQVRDFTANHFIRLFLNGFFINIVNPAVFIFWIGTLAIAISHFQFTGKEIFIYFASVLSTVACMDLVKIYIACWLRSMLTPRIMKGLYLVSGAIFILVGILFIINRMRMI